MMEKEAIFGKQPRVAMAALLAAVVALTLTVPAPAYAASLEAGSVKTTQAATKTTCAKTKKVKKQTFSTDTATINKKATKVGKGTTKLKYKGGKGYIKFVAPTTKKYSFKFSNVTAPGKCYSAFIEVQTPYSDPSYSFLTEVKTAGGKTNTLWLKQKGVRSYTGGKKVYRNLDSRTATITLSKGQAIYFFTSTNYKSVNMKLKVS